MKKMRIRTEGTRVLALLLVLTLLVGVLPAAVLAADSSAVDSDSDGFYRIVHLDCGRKYFTPAWIKALIKEMAAAGYNQLQLAFGNDGLRFLLDDMSVTVDGTTYSSADVTAGIKAGNETYNNSSHSNSYSYSPDVNELTQSEMDDIIAEANKYGIEIVPLLNSPGHMDAILTAMGELGISNAAYTMGYKTSSTTVSLDNNTAIAFTQALIKKYVDYFASKGCSYFNIGADEYANDISGNPLFGSMTTSYYEKFVTYLNTMAEYVVSKGMTPRCFNDGVYYKTHTSSCTVTPNKNLQICYWSSGWDGYNVAAASTLAGYGFDMINTNGDYYYVLGKSNKFSATNYSAAADFSNETFMGSTVSDPAGSMFCIWCDYPGAQTEQEVAKTIRMALRAMGARMQDKSIDTISDSGVVVNGGFDADGNIYTATTGEVETISQDGITISAEKSLSEAEISCTVTIGADTASVNWTITLTDASGSAYAGQAQITLDMTNENFAPFLNVVDLDTLAVLVDGEAVASDVAKIDVDKEAKTITFTTPHFSKITLTGSVKAGETTEPTKIIYLPVGDSWDSSDLNLDGNAVVSWENTEAEGIAGITAEKVNTPGGYELGSQLTMSGNGTYTGVIKSGNYYLVVSSSGTISSTTDIADATVFTITRTSTGYNGLTVNYTIKSGSYYLTRRDTYNYSLTTSSSSANWKYSSTSGFYYTPNSSSYATYYLTCSNGTWTLDNKSASTKAYPYSRTQTEAVSSTTVTVTGGGEGTVDVTINGDLYRFVIQAPNKTKTSNLTYGNKLTLPSGATGITVVSGGEYVTVSGTTVTAGQQDGEAVLTYDTVNEKGKVTAHYTHTINVTEENLSEAGSVTIEYWITNTKVYCNSATSMTVKAEQAYGESGVKIKDLVPKDGNRASTTGDAVTFWKGTRLLSDNKQTNVTSVDKTTKGEDFTYIRYYNGQWSFSADRETWQDINSTDQLVAYYLQVTNVTDEVTTEVVDWGQVEENWSELEYLDDKYVIVDYSVKYESGDEVPSSFPQPMSLGFHCTEEDNNLNVTVFEKDGYYYRRIGLVAAVNTGDYEVYMITVTPTSDDAGSTLTNYITSNTSYEYKGTEQVAWAISDEVLENSGLDAYKSISGTFGCIIGGEPTVSGLEIYRQHGMKVTYYVRAKATEDSLHVHYINKKTGEEIHSYDIAVIGGTIFEEGFALENGELVNNKVMNNLGKEQRVSEDLSTMPSISPAYRYSKYECTNVSRSEDGKDVYLYYTFANWSKDFVVDFGLPLKISGTDLNIEHEEGKSWVTSAVSGAVYGKAENVINETDHTASYLVYTPTEILRETESLQLILYYGENKTEPVVYMIYLIPASTVYYEDSFVKTTNGVIAGKQDGLWETDGTTRTEDVYQALSALESSDRYGYDEVYKNDTMFSLGSAQKVTVTKGMEDDWTDGSSWPTATFTFTGTGFDVISLTSNTSGLITYEVKKGDKTILSKFVTNYYGYDYDGSKWVAATGDNALYQLPVIRVDDLDYGTYDVTITAAYGSFFDSTGNDEYSFWLDGVRVYGTLEDSSIYEQDGEAYPQFIELHDVLCEISKSNGSYNGPFVITSNDPENPTLADYVAKGPNHEVYLEPGDSLAFKLSGDYIKKVMIGMKAVDGSAKYSINGTDGTISTATDMYYDITDVATTGDKIVTISNTGGTILSLTTVKVTFTQNSTATMEMTEAEAQTALMMVRAVFAPVTFTPERLEANWLVSSVRAGQKAILTIKTSEDVEAVIVNGVELTSYRTRRNRSGETWREFNWATTATETMDYAVSAVNADGIESDPITVTLTVKAASGHNGLRDWISGIFGRLF